MTEVEELKAKLDEQKKRIELLEETMQAIGDNSKSEKAREYIRLWRNEMGISELAKFVEKESEECVEWKKKISQHLQTERAAIIERNKKAAETIIEGGFTYQEIDDGIEIVGYNGPETVILEVPDVINGKSVTSIGGAAFAKNSFSKIRLPNTCKVIKETAFAFCSNLKSIKFPDKLVSIGANAFFHCTNLETVLFNENLMQLGYQSFRGTKIKEIALPPLIKDIPECCFGYCEELENVVLNDGLEEIEENAFTETAIKYIILPESVKQVNGRPSESNYSFPFGKEIGMVVMGENTKFTGIPQRATVWCAPMSKARQQAQNAGAWVEAINEYTDFVKMQ